LRRAVLLYALAAVLFVPQYGLELPDLVASPGILSAIALAIAACALGLASRWPDVVLTLLGLSVLAVTTWLDRSGATVPGLNAGPGGSFPLLAFSAVGALAMRAWRRAGPRAFVIGLGLAVPLLVGVLWLGGAWLTERASMYRVHDGQLALLELASDAPRAPARFWNHSALGALGLVAPLIASLWLTLFVGRKLASARVLSPLLLLGRHALAAYVLHLGLLGVIDLVGLAPTTPARTWGLVTVLVGACWGAAWLLDRKVPGDSRKTG
jgi:hypothetical protein